MKRVQSGPLPLEGRAEGIRAQEDPSTFAYECHGFQEMTRKLLIAHNPQLNSHFNPSTITLSLSDCLVASLLALVKEEYIMKKADLAICTGSGVLKAFARPSASTLSVQLSLLFDPSWKRVPLTTFSETGSPSPIQ